MGTSRKDVLATVEMLERLRSIGIGWEDAASLRRISMTLHRWHEMECGDGNQYGSWAIERDDNGDGPPFLVHHHFAHGKWKDSITRTRIADREAGAIKRLRTIMDRYSPLNLGFYIQTDPRGAALYILRPGDVPDDEHPSAYYSRGIAVHK